MLSFAAFATSIISAIIGMGGGILLLSLMTFFLPISVIIPTHGLVQLVSNSTRLLYLRAHIVWPFFGFFLLGAPLGAAAAVFLLKDVLGPQAIYFAIATLIFYSVLKPKKMPSVKPRGAGWAVVGFFAGAVGILAGAVGPMIAPFYMRDDLEKEQIIGTKAAMQMLIHFSKIPAFLYLDFPFDDNTVLIVCLSVCAVGGSRAGVALLGKVDDKLFKKLYKGVLAVSGIRIVFKLIEEGQ